MLIVCILYNLVPIHLLTDGFFYLQEQKARARHHAKFLSVHTCEQDNFFFCFHKGKEMHALPADSML